MFRNDAQVNAVCRVLLEQLYAKGLWTDEGPTETAVSYLEQDGGPLSSGERVLLLCAFAIWNGNEKLPFADLFNLDDDRLGALARFLVAYPRGSTGDRCLDSRARRLPDGAVASSCELSVRLPRVARASHETPRA